MQAKFHVSMVAHLLAMLLLDRNFVLQVSHCFDLERSLRNADGAGRARSQIVF